MAIKYDAILDKVRIWDNIPQLDSNPSSPKSESSWVLKTFTSGGVGAGESYGLLLTLTQPGAGASLSYALKYQTKEGTTIGVALS